MKWGCLGCAALAAVCALGFGGLMVLGALSPPASSRPQSASARKFEAQSECFGAVLRRLRSPSTAEFVPPANVRESGAGRFVVTGRIDATNGFGATIRSRYLCEVAYLEAERRWSVSVAEVF